MARGTPDWGLVSGGLQSVAELDSYLNGFDQAVAANTTLFVASLFNPAASGVNGIVTRVLILLTGAAIEATSITSALLHRTTDLGTGTSQTPRPVDTNSPASPLSLRSNLTVSPTSSFVIWRVTSIFERNITANTPRITEFNLPVEIYRHPPGDVAPPLKLRPGQGIGIAISTGSMGANVSWLIEHTEEPA